MSQTILPPVALEYPSGDGRPMAENDAQLLAIHYGIGALRVYYRDRADVYVSGDLLMYYEEHAARRVAESRAAAATARAEREAALRQDEVAARRAAEARIAELEALLRGQNR